ncbi:MAG: transposase [Solirubrobacterales bacterium]|nr:transposase [Solirubrobacterales bacterium]
MGHQPLAAGLAAGEGAQVAPELVELRAEQVGDLERDGDPLERVDGQLHTYRALAADAGQAPVAVESGKARHAQFRWAWDHRLRQAVCTLADASRRHNPWAADIYDRARARGASHTHATRILGRAWCRPSGASSTTTTPTNPSSTALQRLIATAA